MFLLLQTPINIVVVKNISNAGFAEFTQCVVVGTLIISKVFFLVVANFRFEMRSNVFLIEIE